MPSNDNINSKRLELAAKIREKTRKLSTRNQTISDKHISNDNNPNGKAKQPSIQQEASHWVHSLAKKLASNPGKINPTVSKFVADKAREQRAKQINNTMRGGSVPHVATSKNPWHTPEPSTSKEFTLVGKPGLGSSTSGTKHQFKNENVNEVATQHGWHFIAKKILKHKKLMPKLEDFISGKELQEKSPPGWENTVKHMKKHKEITNPWALAWWEKNQGYHSHK